MIIDNIMNIDIFTLIGKLVIIILIILLILIIITLILGLYTTKNKKLLFPSLLLFTLSITYPIIKHILKLLNIDDLIIDRVSIDLRNQLYKEKFKTLKAEDVIVVVPHCLRHQECPAKLDSSGLNCVECGKCCIGVIHKVTSIKNMRLFIIPGSTFIKNIVKKNKFKGVIGVACPIDLNNAMTNLDNFNPQGVYLLNDGCINTVVNVDEVIELINSTLPVTEYKKEDFE